VIAPPVKTVLPLDPYVVRVIFADGEIRDVDIEPLLEGPVFRPLWDRRLFAKVFVDEEAGTIAWPNHVDLDREVIYGAAEAEGDRRPRITVPEHA
jgi:Protein of unknown function (DUF2442)